MWDNHGDSCAHGTVPFGKLMQTRGAFHCEASPSPGMADWRWTWLATALPSPTRRAGIPACGRGHDTHG
jgi:hypothetical protein